MLNKEDKAMVRETARGLNGPDAADFETAVTAPYRSAVLLVR